MSAISSFWAELRAQYPGINLIVQDKGTVIQYTGCYVECKNTLQLSLRKNQICCPRFLQENPVVCTDIYWLWHAVVNMTLDCSSSSSIHTRSSRLNYMLRYVRRSSAPTLQVKVNIQILKPISPRNES